MYLVFPKSLFSIADLFTVCYLWVVCNEDKCCVVTQRAADIRVSSLVCLACLRSHVLRAYCNFESKQANSITLFGRRPNNKANNTFLNSLRKNEGEAQVEFTFKILLWKGLGSPVIDETVKKDTLLVYVINFFGILADRCSSQRAKNLVSDSPGLVDFAIGLVNSVLNLPDGQVK